MMLVSFQLVVLLASTSLSMPFHLSRSPMTTGSKIPKLCGPSVCLEMTAPAISSDEKNVDSDTALDDELQVATSKLKVLEHVVKKMKKKSDESSASWEKRLAEENKKYAKTVGELQSIKKKYSDAKKALVDERDKHDRQVEKLTSDYEDSKTKYTKQISGLTKREASYQRDLRSLEAKVNKMEGTIAEMAEDRRGLQTTLKSERSRHNSILDDQYRKEEHLSEELDKIYAERDEVLLKLEEARSAGSVNAEAVEIAKSSVAAAERRESMLKEKYTALQVEYDGALDEIQHLQERISTMVESCRSLEEKVKSASAASKAADTELQENVETLKNSIVELRMLHSAELRKQQREAESQIAKMRDDHYKQVQQFRKALMERNDTFEKRGLWQRVRKLLRRN